MGMGEMCYICGMDRREFIKGAMMGAAMIAAPKWMTAAAATYSAAGEPVKAASGAGRMKLSFAPYELQLRHSFNLAKFSRTTTPDVLVKIELDGVTGYGEASMPPYLGESV